MERGASRAILTAVPDHRDPDVVRLVVTPDPSLKVRSAAGWTVVFALAGWFRCRVRVDNGRHRPRYSRPSVEIDADRAWSIRRLPGVGVKTRAAV